MGIDDLTIYLGGRIIIMMEGGNNRELVRVKVGKGRYRAAQEKG